MDSLNPGDATATPIDPESISGYILCFKIHKCSAKILKNGEKNSDGKTIGLLA